MQRAIALAAQSGSDVPVGALIMDASGVVIAEADLEDHYRRRNLLGVTIDPDDVAEVAWWLASDSSRKTTGTVVTVDGGVAAAFPR